MRIPEISNQIGGSLYYQGYRDTGAAARPLDAEADKPAGALAPESSGAGAAAPESSGTMPIAPESRGARPVAPEGSGAGRAGEPYYTPDGDILDFDWDRIRRFVQRFAWDTEPPETIKDFKDFRDRSNPVFSWDGDKAEFNFKPPETGKKTYGSEGAAKPAAPEPKGRCATCESRRYVDKSNDSSVSYQTPTKLSPGTAALAVGAHEREHVFNERAKADREGREIVSQTVSIKYGICPECHRMYPTGGVTRTLSVTAKNTAPEPASDSGSPATDGSDK